MLDKYYLEEIQTELESLEIIVTEISSIINDYSDVVPDIRAKTLLGSFLAQFYMGVENILKKLVKATGQSLPKSENWHLELFKSFCDPPLGNFPVLFDNDLERKMANFRRFRHVVFHGYGFRLDWEIMLEGSGQLDDTFVKFKKALKNYLESATSNYPRWSTRATK